MAADPVVFDIGNVLVRWDPVPAVAASVGDERAMAFLGDPEFDFLAWNHLQDEGRPWEEAERVARGAFPHYADEITAYRVNFEASLVGEIEGSVAIVQELRDAGVPLVALTNWSAELFGHARARFEVLEAFDDIVVSGEEGCAKPDPRIFEVLAERLGRPLDGVVFTDDSPRNILAAGVAGMDAIPFTTPEDLRGELVDRGLPLARA
ncbi:HAD family phosphatase [Mumia sp. zg.B53]|uniref:HAD family hydrolase n=1 Tax=unclassified Mumia TaxID=2621872 RepID=UPI001C6F332F|nr:MULTISPECIES: HAD family phosphatase [unclassified Mumia]MBW9204618.1 HAD family phosphatase [Mumia sp. zg.B17]MBW9213986.1 HAD family phosphatase [Mumia sp. zg.B53]MDD9347228.1 HAD family phosphatase [Mumia sp.]